MRDAQNRFMVTFNKFETSAVRSITIIEKHHKDREMRRLTPVAEERPIKEKLTKEKLMVGKLTGRKFTPKSSNAEKRSPIF